MQKIAAISILLCSCACDKPRPWDGDIFYNDHKHDMCRNLKDAKKDKPGIECDGYLMETVDVYKMIDNTITSCQEQLKACQQSK
jgi:hypothetical protein